MVIIEQLSPIHTPVSGYTEFQDRAVIFGQDTFINTFGDGVEPCGEPCGEPTGGIDAAPPGFGDVCLISKPVPRVRQTRLKRGTSIMQRNRFQTSQGSQTIRDTNQSSLSITIRQRVRHLQHFQDVRQDHHAIIITKQAYGVNPFMLNSSR